VASAQLPVAQKTEIGEFMQGHFVVTGGAGFIGSALVRRLLAEEVGRVVVIDNLMTGSEANLEEVCKRIEFHRADVRDYAEIAPLIRGAAVVFHEAAIASVPRSIANPVPSHDVNINGTFNVLRAAREEKAGRVVYAASSSAYGDTEVLPKIETLTPKPKSPYALQKLTGELYCNVFAEVYGVETVSLRYFNVYGPRQDPMSPYSGVLSVFMRSILERTPPTINGDGEQSRDFTFVEDVVSLNWKAARARIRPGQVYNGGNGGRVTLNQAWALLQKLEGIDLPPRYGPEREGDVRHSQADTTAVQRDLGHAPQYSFEEGMKRTLEWYRASLGALSAVEPHAHPDTEPRPPGSGRSASSRKHS
jgi:UDP-N-acetylglucosamine/UDP-N-acetyl-alpha-D-glucosaminouronate 4-epimerase